MPWQWLWRDGEWKAGERGRAGKGTAASGARATLCAYGLRCVRRPATEVTYRNYHALSLHGYEPHQINGDNCLEDGALGLLAFSLRVWRQHWSGCTLDISQKGGP